MKKSRLIVIVFIAIFLTSIPIFSYINLITTGIDENSPVGWDKRINELTEQLCSDCGTDEERVRCIYQWIIENIEYDYEYDGIYQYFDAVKTVETRKGICFDYANLFASMCRSQDIPCFVIDGYKKIDSTAKHTWNRVYFHDVWWNLDSTYDAICKKEGKELYGLKNIGVDPKCSDEDYIITRIY